MKVITFGDIMDGGRSVFTSVATLDGARLKVAFEGEIRIDNPHKHLGRYLEELAEALADAEVEETLLDFTALRFCNSNGFYIIMDLTEAVYENAEGPVTVRRLREDDWQQETLAILIDIDEDPIRERTTFLDIDADET